MRLVFLYKAAGHIFLNRYKYMVLAFFYLTGFMCGTYSADGLSDALRLTIRANLEARFYTRSPDATVVFLSVLVAGAFWIFGFSSAGMAAAPLILMTAAALQSFFMQISLTDIGLSEGFTAAGGVVLFVLWSAAGLFLSEISIGNALQMLSGRKLNLSFVERAALVRNKTPAFVIAGFIFVLLSYLTFLANKAIF